MTIWAQFFCKGRVVDGCCIFWWKIIPERRDAGRRKIAEPVFVTEAMAVGRATAGDSLPHLPSPVSWPHPMTQAQHPSIMHHMKSDLLADTLPSNTQSVESESDHLMLNLISPISPCLQLVYMELKVHVSCLLWVLWVILKSSGIARVQLRWWSAAQWEKSCSRKRYYEVL